MENFSELMLKLIEEEKQLEFEKFSNHDALLIGNILIDKAKNRKINITIEIVKSDQMIFHYAFDGTSLDNDFWVKRKINVVKRFHRSSYYIKTKLQSKDENLQDKYGLSKETYGAYGGAFPIRIKNTGVIGAICVSGLKQEEDHELVVETIREYLLNAGR
ncbi:MAG: heme-degrading domain-containing protein [Clostridiaceae bacterium]